MTAPSVTIADKDGGNATVAITGNLTATGEITARAGGAAFVTLSGHVNPRRQAEQSPASGHLMGWIEDAGLPVPIADGALPPANASGDVYVLWDNENAYGDWSLAEGDLQTGQDLETACLVSLFTDKLATPDFVPTDGTCDRRGWWADPYHDAPLGSNLWQLERAKKTRDTLALARRYAIDALQWLVDDGVAKDMPGQYRMARCGGRLDHARDRDRDYQAGRLANPLYLRLGLAGPRGAAVLPPFRTMISDGLRPCDFG